jgi:RNA polymerase sigma-70 factor, ECF subfamily
VPEFRSIFDEHAPFVWRLLRTMGVPERTLDDVLQEVFLTVHDKLPSFEGRSGIRTWICAIAYRVGANARRKTQRRAEVELDQVPEIGHAHSPDQHTEYTEATEFVQEYCATLGEGMRDVFVLCLLEERPAVEVAELLGLSPNTVSSRVRLLRGAFRLALAEHYQIKETL